MFDRIPSLRAIGIYSKANMPNANKTSPVANVPMAQRFREHSLGPHRTARDTSASSEKNLFSMRCWEEGQYKKGQSRGQQRSEERTGTGWDLGCLFLQEEEEEEEEEEEGRTRDGGVNSEHTGTLNWQK